MAAVEGIGALARQRLVVVVDLPGSLDGDLLRRAVQVTAISTPESVRWFRPGRFRSWWRTDDGPAWNVDEIAADDDRSAEEIEHELFDSPYRPEVPLEITLQHRDGGDRLLLSVNHLLADGGGTKELTYRIAEACRELSSDPGWTPAPLRRRHVLWRLLRGLKPLRVWHYLVGIFDQFWALRPGAGISIQMDPREESRATFRRLRLSAERIGRLRERWKPAGATVNDLLVAAYGRALERFLGPAAAGKHVSLVVTADLRQLLDDPPHVENLSAIHTLRLGKAPLPPPDRMLARVHRITWRWKRLGVGHPFAVYSICLATALPAGVLRSLVAWMVTSGPAAQASQLVLTNMGRLDPERLDFGGGPCADAYILPPVARPPALIAGATGFAGAVDLTVAYHEPAMTGAEAARLVAALDDELEALS